MLSAILPSESLLSNTNINPLFAFNGGFTPWENLESFFTPTHLIPNDQNKPSNLSCYHAGFGLGLGAESPNLSRYHAKSDISSEIPNLSRYHANSDLGSEILNKISPSFDKPILGSYHVGSDLGSDSTNKRTCFDEPNLSRYHANLETTNQQSPPFDELNLSRCHVGSDLDPEDFSSNLKPAFSSSSSGSDDPNQNGSRSAEAVINTDERKRKRKISNRESARRSRMRKQKHIENLRNDANELKVQTRERSNQLRLMTHQIQLVRGDNERLKAESIILQRKFMQLSHIWKLQLLQQQRSYLHHHAPRAPSCTPMQIHNLTQNERI